MGNSLGGKRKSAKVMQLDGSSFRVKPPAAASDVLRDHPGFQLLESEEVKLLGARARPLAPDAPLRRGRLYFLVALPRRAPAAGNMRRAWSGNLRVGARERLESLMLARRSTSDLSSLTPAHASASAPTSPLPSGATSPLPAAAAGAAGGGATPVRLKMRLPRAQVEKLMGESKDPAEAAAKIMELCGAAAMGADARASARVTPERPPGILRSPRFAKTPEWGAGFMLPPPAPAKTPQRWPTLPRTKEVIPSAHRFNPIPHVHCIIVCSHPPHEQDSHAATSERDLRSFPSSLVTCNALMLLNTHTHTKKKSLTSRLENNAPKCKFVLRSCGAFGSCLSTHSVNARGSKHEQGYTAACC
jgi:hypothetical protein